jgi:hypothetical protein
MGKSVSIAMTEQTVIVVGTVNCFMTVDKLNPLIRCRVFSSQRTVLRGWLTEVTQRWRHRYKEKSDTGRQINPLKPSGYYMYHCFNILEL